ncbi:hypothetical protein ABPG77_004683 [Micractinium sp. CCAP 211/92]
MQSASAQDAEEWRRCRQQQRRLVGCTLDWQLTGRVGPVAAAALHHSHAATLQQRAILESHAWQRPVLGGSPLSPEEAGSILCAQWDSSGELLVAGNEEGLLTVHRGAALAGAGWAPTPVPPAQQVVGTADPLLLLDTHMPKLQAVRWNPADENVVGAVSAATRQLLLYDLQHTQGQPRQALVTPQQSASSGLAGSTAVGLTDLAFFNGGAAAAGGGGGGYAVLASGNGGQVFLWDTRVRSAPSATLAAQQGSGALHAVQLAPCGQVVLAGSQSGEVKLWDLRGGSTSTLRFGGTVHHHPLLASVNLRYALTAVPGLASQTPIPASGVHSMQLDPSNPCRLAFHLGCGWSGVLHLHSGAVTHLHAPSHALFAEEAPGGLGDEGAATASVAQMLLWASTAAPALHRQAAWTPDGRRYCVPSRRDDTLLLLDFADSPEAGCYALQDEAEHEQKWPARPAGRGASQDELSGGALGRRGSGQEGWQAAPPAVSVQLSQAAVCCAAHPGGDLLVAGSMNSCLSVVGLA